ncbi:MAG: hypothetical protein KME05_20915 [Gloeocapsa sp. UFS-A4-WI-NPMV-4B04]|nr:hypothetical protein [Gloeocapsa sp. UFS-A4-WI-NPMV-4B04]
MNGDNSNIQALAIAAKEQKRIFERFYQVNSDRRYIAGSQLSLPIAAAHVGIIQVQSELGKSSTFTIRLPWHSSFPILSDITQLFEQGRRSARDHN